jgi:hypothetical protein
MLLLSMASFSSRSLVFVKVSLLQCAIAKMGLSLGRNWLTELSIRVRVGARIGILDGLVVRDDGGDLGVVSAGGVGVVVVLARGDLVFSLVAGHCDGCFGFLR